VNCLAQGDLNFYLPITTGGELPYNDSKAYPQGTSMRPVLLLLIFTIVAMVCLTTYDEPLSPQSRQMIEHLEQQRSQNGEPYYYLLGIDAPVADTIIEKGKKLSQSDIKRDNNLYTQAASKEATLPFPPTGHLLHCDIVRDDDCLARLLRRSDSFQPHIEQYQAVLQRYQRFLEYSEFHSVMGYQVDSVYPNYAFLISANQLLQLKALQAALEHSPQYGLSILLPDFERLRFHLSQSDSLLHTMVFSVMLHRDLALAAYLLEQGAQLEEPIAPLTASEFSLANVLTNEFGMVYQLVEQGAYSDNYSALLGSDSSSRYQDIVVGIGFKPNMTLNDTAANYHNLRTIAEQPSAAFAQNHDIDSSKPIWRQIVNYIGYVLAEVAKPDLIQYMARLHDLNTKIALVNYLNDPSRTPFNPYYPDERPRVPPTGKWCQSGPFEDVQQLRCIMRYPPDHLTSTIKAQQASTSAELR
tara:strand:- start:2630 stop:4036 length:1407 start_codon:yes stop_codon:yes gene_type:complete